MRLAEIFDTFRDREKLFDRTKEARKIYKRKVGNWDVLAGCGFLADLGKPHFIVRGRYDFVPGELLSNGSEANFSDITAKELREIASLRDHYDLWLKGKKENPLP